MIQLFSISKSYFYTTVWKLEMLKYANIPDTKKSGQSLPQQADG